MIFINFAIKSKTLAGLRKWVFVIIYIVKFFIVLLLIKSSSCCCCCFQIFFSCLSVVERSPGSSPVYSKRCQAATSASFTANSPNTSQIFSLDNSFFNSYVQEIDLATTEKNKKDEDAEEEHLGSESEDMFADCEEEVKTVQHDPRSKEVGCSSSSISNNDESQLLSSLPLSVLDIKVI